MKKNLILFGYVLLILGTSVHGVSLQKTRLRAQQDAPPNVLTSSSTPTSTSTPIKVTTTSGAGIGKNNDLLSYLKSGKLDGVPITITTSEGTKTLTANELLKSNAEESTPQPKEAVAMPDQANLPEPAPIIPTESIQPHVLPFTLENDFKPSVTDIVENIDMLDAPQTLGNSVANGDDEEIVTFSLPDFDQRDDRKTDFNQPVYTATSDYAEKSWKPEETYNKPRGKSYRATYDDKSSNSQSVRIVLDNCHAFIDEDCSSDSQSCSSVSSCSSDSSCSDE